MLDEVRLVNHQLDGRRLAMIEHSRCQHRGGRALVGGLAGVREQARAITGEAADGGAVQLTAAQQMAMGMGSGDEAKAALLLRTDVFERVVSAWHATIKVQTAFRAYKCAKAYALVLATRQAQATRIQSLSRKVACRLLRTKLEQCETMLRDMAAQAGGTQADTARLRAEVAELHEALGGGL